MNSNKINITDAILEFLEVAIHNVLFVRKVYPDKIFTAKKKYGVPVQVCTFPELNSYISNSLEAAKTVLKNNDLKSLDLYFYNPDKVPIDKVVFHLKKIKAWKKYMSTDDPYLIELRESFRALCLKLAVHSEFLQTLPKGTSFKILIHTTEASSVSLAIDPQFENFPLVRTDEKIGENCRISPINNIYNDLLKMNIYVEESVQAH